jgi:hypothetical protein
MNKMPTLYIQNENILCVTIQPNLIFLLHRVIYVVNNSHGPHSGLLAH